MMPFTSAPGYGSRLEHFEKVSMPTRTYVGTIKYHVFLEVLHAAFHAGASVGSAVGAGVGSGTGVFCSLFDNTRPKLHAVASANAPADIPRAPFMPNLLMDRNTDTTMRLRGMPNKFIMMDLWLSGMYLLLNVPIVGKYTPTHNSNAKKLANKAAKCPLMMP